MKKNLLLGAHMSISGGIENSIKRGESIGCNCIQIFTKSNRQWKAKDLLKKEIEIFKKEWEQSNIKIIISHASYLINLCSPKKDISKKSIDGLKKELIRCNKLNIPFLVFHPGSHLGTGEENCIKKIIKIINQILEKVDTKTKLLLENMAGQGTSIGYKFEHLGEIIKNINQKNRIGVCFDTCHAFAAGYDFRTKKTYKKMWEDFDKHIGITKLKVIHINDSREKLGSKIDRHASIGEGELGLTPFKFIVNDKRFSQIPKILETPKENGLEKDKININIIKSLLK